MSENRLSPSDMATLKQLLEDECDYKLPENVMEEFLSFGRVITYGKWDNVILEGDINPDIYIAMEGIVRCFYWDGDKEKTAFFSTLPTLFMSYHRILPTLLLFIRFRHVRGPRYCMFVKLILTIYLSVRICLPCGICVCVRHNFIILN